MEGNDTPTTVNTIITIEDIPNSFLSRVKVTITNADGSTISEDSVILKNIADLAKILTKAQILVLFTRNNPTWTAV